MEDSANSGDVGSAVRWFNAWAQRGTLGLELPYEAVIRSFATAGDTEGALRWLGDMMANGLTPTLRSLNPILRACEGTRNVSAAERVMERMRSAGVAPNKFSYASLISTCALAGDLTAAVKWMGAMDRQPDLHGDVSLISTHNLVLRSFVKDGDIRGVVAWFGQMSALGAQPNANSYNAVIQTCAEAGDPVAAAEWFEALVGTGLTPDENSYVEVVRAHIKANDAQGAANWFERMLVVGTPPSEDAYLAIINTYVQARDTKSAEQWFKRMVDAGVQPDRRAYTAIIRVHAEFGNTISVKSWLRQMRDAQVAPDTVTYNAALAAFQYAKDAAGAAAILGQMSRDGVELDELSYGLAIRTLAEVGDVQGTMVWAERMHLMPKLAPSRLPHDKIVMTLAGNGHVDGASEWAFSAQKTGKSLRLGTYKTLIKACLRLKQSNRARGWLKNMREAGVYPTREIFKMFIKNSADNRSEQAAAAWHAQMEAMGISGNTATYNLVITAFSKAGKRDEVFSWMDKMVVAGYRPDRATYTSVIDHFAKQKDLAKAAEWFEKMGSDGVRPDVKTYTTMMKAYIKKGDIGSASAWLNWMSVEGLQPDVPSFNLVLAAYASRGDTDAAEALFEKAVSLDVKPTERTYVHMVESYANMRQTESTDKQIHAESAMKWTQAMEDAGFKPNVDVHAALARARAAGGDLAGTEEMLEKMRASERALSPDAKRKTLAVALELFERMQDREALERWTAWSNMVVPKQRDKKTSQVKRRYVKRPIMKKISKTVSRKPTANTLSKQLLRASTDGDSDLVLSLIREMALAGVKVGPKEYSRALETFVAGNGRTSRPESAAAVMKSMVDSGVTPDQYCYHLTILSFAEAGDAEGAVSWFEHMHKANLLPEQKHHTWVVYAMKAAETRRTAKKVNTTALYERVVAAAGTPKQRKMRFDLIIRNNAALGDLETAEQYVRLADERGIRPTKSTCMIAAGECLKAGRLSSLLWWLQRPLSKVSQQGLLSTSELLRDFVHQSITTNEGTFDAEALDTTAAWMRQLSLSQVPAQDLPHEEFVAAYAGLGKPTEAAIWLDKMIDVGLSPSPAAYRELALCNVRAGRMADAKQWIERLRLSGAATDEKFHHTVVLCHAMGADVPGALAGIEAMQADGFESVSEAHSMVISGLSKAGKAADANQWLDRALEAGAKPSQASLQDLMQVFIVDEGDIRTALDVAQRASAAGLPIRAGVAGTAARSFSAWRNLLSAAANRPDGDQAKEEVAEEALRLMVRDGTKLSDRMTDLFRMALGPNRFVALCKELKLKSLDKVLLDQARK